MIKRAVPGFSEMFGGPKPGYHELLKNVSPHNGVVYCISVNYELRASLPYEANQARIMQHAPK
jgi:hypothetical protein